MNSRFLQILQFFPYVLAGVAAVEQIAGNQTGATKKQILLDSLTAAAKIGEVVPNSQVSLVSGIADATITALNASGVFTHATPAAPATA